jgi:outer membrane autotransporter protein
MLPFDGWNRNRGETMISGTQRKLLLGSSMAVLVLLGQGPLAYAACVGQPSPVFLCSGNENALQSIFATDATVTTDPDFNLDVGIGGALIVSGDGNISFTDINAYGHRSNIKAHGYSALYIFGGNGPTGSVTVNTDGTLYGAGNGINAANQGGGLLSITTGEGSITGALYFGIYGRDNGLGTGVSVTTGDGNILGGQIGIKAKNQGTGTLLVTTGNGSVTGETGVGVSTFANVGTAGTTITTGDGEIYGRVTGINAVNYGGLLSVTTGAGKVTGTNYYGIRSYSKGGGQVVTTGDGDVTGGQDGIHAINYGAGYLNIFTGSGKVTGTAGEGISAFGDVGTTSMSITTGSGAVSGGTNGIAAQNNGLGSLIITTEGGNVEGGQDGVHAFNRGNGALVVTTGSGNVSGLAGSGIFAFGDVDSTSVTVNTGAGRVSGATHGVSAENKGSGGLFVTSGNGEVQGGTDGIKAINSGDGSMSVVTGAGNVTGVDYYGIEAYGKINGESLTITTGNGEIQGGNIGIMGFNAGSGALSITTGAGKVTGSQNSGINAFTRGAGVSVKTGDGGILGQIFGIYSGNAGSGKLLIETGAGSVTGTAYHGIYANGQLDSDSVTVITGDGAISGGRNGIKATNSGDGSMTVTTGAGNVTGSTAFGIEAVGKANGDAMTVTTGNGEILGGDTGITGVNFGSGALSITAGAGKVTGSNFIGIYAYTKGIGVSVNTGDGGILGKNYGIYTTNLGNGALLIDTGAGSVTGTVFEGISAFGDIASDSLTVHTGDGAVSGGRFGISAENLGSGGLFVTSANGNIDGGTDAIWASNSGSGSMTVTTGTGKVTGDQRTGIRVLGESNGQSVTVSTGTGDVSGGFSGIDVSNFGSGALSVTAGTGKVTGSVDSGIFAYAKGDGLSVATGDGFVLGGRYGISVENKGIGVLSVTTAKGDVKGGSVGIKSTNPGFSSMTITTGVGKVTGTDGNGIEALGAATSTTLTITTGVGAVTGGNHGISAEHNGSGRISVATGKGEVKGATSGIHVTNSGSGSLAVTTGVGSITGQADYGINAESKVAASGLSIATGTGAVLGGKQGIRATQNGNGDFTITVGGLVSNLAKNVSGEAINTFGKGVTLSTLSTGNITGRITTDRGAFDDVFNNSGLWISTGTSDFGGGANHINNRGIVRVANSRGVSETSTFKNAGDFTNRAGSLLTLSDETPRNGSTTHDTLSIFGDFVGGGALAVDAFLGGPGSTADVLTINGNITGKTSLRVNNTNPLTGPANADGIAIVSYTGAASDDAYFLENGPLAVGLFTYDLAHDNAAKVFELIGAGMSVDGSGLATLVSAAETIWHDTSGVLGDRLDELRGDESAAAVVDQAHIQPVSYSASPNAGLWAKILGRTSNRDVNSSLSYDMDVTGFVAGVDEAVNQSIIGGALALGATGGYVNANQDYSSGAKARYEGFSGGIYATYANSGFHLDGELRANLLNLDYTVVAAPTSHSNVTSLGGSLDAGYRFEIGNDAYVEPLAHLAYVDTAIRDGDVMGVAFIGDGESLRGALGLNIGGTFNGMENIVFKPKFSAKIWDEFKGDNTASFAAITVYDKLPETFGELGLNLEAVNVTNGWSAQINGDIQFAKGFTSIGGFVGLGKNF